MKKFVQSTVFDGTINKRGVVLLNMEKYVQSIWWNYIPVKFAYAEILMGLVVKMKCGEGGGEGGGGDLTVQFNAWLTK